MLSKYFTAKTNTQKFDNDMRWSMGEIYGKRVIIFGAGEDFLTLNKKYKFNKELNVVAIADKRFETENFVDFYGMRAIKPADIVKEDYDVILISNENPKEALDYVFNELNIQGKDIRTMFNEEVKNERENYIYLTDLKFEKTLPKLVKKLEGKTVVLYGADEYLELIKKYFDISGLNIIAVSDRKYENGYQGDFLGYRICAPKEILDLNPDYVVLSSKNYIDEFEYLYKEILRDTKIKIKPLVKKSFVDLLKEVFKH